MIKEYRFKGVSGEGKLIHGTFIAANKKEAKLNIKDISKKHGINILDFEEKKDFIYIIKLPNKQTIKGKQSAFTKEEIASGLKEMGFHDFIIKPILFNFKRKPSSQEIQTFIKLASTMLDDKMKFGEILNMLAEEQTNATFKDTLFQIEKQLKMGKEGKEVFNRYADIFGKFPAFMLGLATKSGNMAEIFKATNKFISRDNEIKQQLKKALVSPAFAVLATLGAVTYYIIDIFPSTAKMFIKFGIEVPTLTRKTLELSDWLGIYYIYILLAIFIPIIIIWRWWATEKGKIWRDKFIIQLPVIGHLIHKSSIEIFFRVFATVYGGSADNIETIKTSAEACRNKYMEKAVKEVTLPRMLIKGEAFVPSMEASKVFTKSVITRLRTGSETGNILESAKQISVYYEAETKDKMDILIEYIQTFIGLFIAIVISFLTIVSAEIATVQPV
ncbi:MAG: type II secretion system F family protein [Candidatus Cloacimonetes bacterium]|nr:type II secretion system F family protein [Candidatus Cloacimonadota bacterium]